MLLGKVWLFGGKVGSGSRGTDSIEEFNGVDWKE